MTILKPAAAALFLPLIISAQAEPQRIAPILKQSIQPIAVTEFQIRQFLRQRIPELPTPRTAEQWAVDARRLRQKVLSDVIFHGWPHEWVNSRPSFHDAGLVAGERGVKYRIRKLRYEIVPGFESTALLYEPADLRGRVPAILNVTGHVGKPGKAVEYEQKRAINYALQGMIALTIEWMGCGEMDAPENHHDFAAHLDLTGRNAVGLFYLAMRRGLDYLWEHPAVDRTRIGMTGLSGGGWQTIVLSALDERVTAAVPVAGYGSLQSNIVHPRDTSEIEEDATDLAAALDYTHLTAMRAPRPTLLIFNAEDDCCFRAPMVKPFVFDAVRPFFALYGRPDWLSWHENTNPGTHNYQQDNRRASCRFFTEQFGLPVTDREIGVDAEIRTREELAAGLPAENLTVLGVARKLAAQIVREQHSDGEQRRILADVLRYRATRVESAWMEANSDQGGIDSRAYAFAFDSGLGATGVQFMSSGGKPTTATIVLHDRGKREVAEIASERINRGEIVLALDLLLTGELAPERPAIADYALLLATTGVRPLGVEAAQLIAVAKWLRSSCAGCRLRVETSGIRTQVMALAAAALAPDLFNDLVTRDGMSSLRHLFDAPVKYRSAPDLFCLDLYKYFDIESLERLAAPVAVEHQLPRTTAGVFPASMNSASAASVTGIAP